MVSSEKALKVVKPPSRPTAAKTRTVSCPAPPRDSGRDEGTVVVGTWPAGTEAAYEERFPLAIGGHEYGTLQVRWKEAHLPIDVDLARIWANHLAAVLASKEGSESDSRSARAEAMQAAGGSFLAQLDELERSLRVDTPAPTPEQSSHVTKAVRRIELFKNDLGMITQRPSVAPAAPPRAVGTVVETCLRDIAAAHGGGIEVRSNVLTGPDDLAPQPHKVEAVLRSLLEYSAQAQARNPAHQPRFLELTVKRVRGDAIRIMVQSNAPALDRDAVEALFSGTATQEVPSKDGLLTLPVVKMSVESMGGTLDYDPGDDFGTLFSIRLPLDPSATATA